MKKRSLFQVLEKRLREPRRSIQVLLGPRQVGKTTLALQLSQTLGRPCYYASADFALLQDLTWLQQQWGLAVDQLHHSGHALLILDEVQKIPHWSDLVKHLWDRDTRLGQNLSVLILGSSPWLMERGLTESLAGRFEVIPVTHWSFVEMQEHFGWTLDKFLYYGGYPGAAHLADDKSNERWVEYINQTLIETTVSRDVLLMTQVNKPALLRRLFSLSCVYSGQVLSYQKMVGQLQEAGNTTTLAHYLDLLERAWLVGGLPKYAQQLVRRKGSSPKLAVYNTALMTAQLGKDLGEIKKDRALFGRLVESAVGAHLLNSVRGTQIELSYWREGNAEVDFVLRRGSQLIAIEVKSNDDFPSGMGAFAKHFQPTRQLLIGEQGMALERFLSTTPADLFR